MRKKSQMVLETGQQERYVHVPGLRRPFLKSGILCLMILFTSVPLLMARAGMGQELSEKIISVGAQKSTLKSILKRIEQASKLSFIVPVNEVEKYYNIDLPEADRSVKQTLDLLLRNTNLSYRQYNENSVLIYVKPQVKSIEKLGPTSTNNLDADLRQLAEVTVTGKVTDESGEPLPGVTIVEKATSNGTTTDGEGKFQISVRGTASVLVFSYVGHLPQEVTPGNQSVLNIKLKVDEKNLSEVVVVGYGTQSRASLTGSVATINSKSLENRPITNLANGLQGISPGLNVTRGTGQPGNEEFNVTIRGATSANGAVPPLVILDGVSAPSTVLTSINPNDIESISVLKDAAAATVYGAQAAGGVILITTKKGKEEKLRINFSTQVAANQLINLPQRMSLMDEALFNNLAFTNAGSSKQYSDFDLENIRNNVPYVVNPNDTTKYTYYNQVSPNDVMLKKYAMSQQHNLSLTGGTQKLNFFLSGGVFNQKGALKVGENDTKRYNARLNLGAEINKYISLDTRLSYTRQEVNSPNVALSGDYGIFYEISRLRMRNPQFTPEGRYNSAASTYAKLESGGYDHEVRNDMEGVFTLKISNLVKGLTLRGVYGIQYRRQDEDVFARTVPLWGRYAIEGYLNPTNSYSMSQTARKNMNVQYLADYNLTIAEKHALTFLAGFQYEDFRSTNLLAGATNLISNDTPLLNFGDALTKTNSQSISTYAYQSYFGRLNYTFAKRYIAEVTYRVDESSKLAPGLRRKGFAAVSGAWNVHEEKWFGGLANVFSEMKLRASWGQLGGSLGSSFPFYGWANTLARGTGLVLGDQRTAYNFQSSIPSSTTSWETITTTNYGVDLGLLNHKLRFSGDYYVKYNRNMLTTQMLPATLGIGAPQKNNGELKSWGWETELTYRDRIGENFNFNVGFNLSDNQNKLLKFSNAKVVSLGTNGKIEGYALNSVFGYQTDGYFTSQDEVTNWAFQNNKTGAGDVKYIDKNGDNRISVGDGVLSNTGDMVYLGTTNPRYLYGFNMGFDIKGFDFTAFLQGVGKRNYMPGVRTLMPLFESWRSPMEFQNDFWTPEHQDALFPRPYYQSPHNYLTSDKWVLNAAYMRLKNIQVGYSLPASVNSRLKISRARVYVSAQDILTFSRAGAFKTMFDPEAKDGVVNDYPFFSSISVGLNINL